MKTTRPPMDKFEVLIVKKFHWIAGIVMTILIPTVSVTAAYYKGRSEIDMKISQIREEHERDFVRKSEFEKMQAKIDTMSGDVSEIKGMLKASANPRRN